MVRKPEFPLAKIIRRLSEKADTEIEKKVYPKLSKQHNNGPLTECVVGGHQFHKIETGKYILKTSFKDSCVRIHEKVSLIKNIIMSGDAEILFVYQSFQATNSFF